MNGTFWDRSAQQKNTNIIKGMNVWRAYHDDDGARAKQIKRIYKKKTKKNTTHV